MAEGILPVAISVDAPGVSDNLRSKRGYTFPFLSDPKAQVIRRYELLHPGGGQTAQIFRDQLSF